MPRLPERDAPPTWEAAMSSPSVLHPLLVRITHWVNAAAMTVMIMSGWEIHNAHPIAPFPFPSTITLGGG